MSFNEWKTTYIRKVRGLLRSADIPGLVDYLPHPAEMTLCAEAAAERPQAKMCQAGVAPTPDPATPFRLARPHHGHARFHADAGRVAPGLSSSAVCREGATITEGTSSIFSVIAAT